MTAIRQIDRWAGEGPDFNRAAAEVVFKAMSSMDEDEALIFGRLLVHGAVLHDLIEHREVVQKRLADDFTRRTLLAKAAMRRSAISKSRAGEDNTSELNALIQLEMVAKAYDPREHRDSGGRFAEGHVRVGYNDKLKPLPDAHARQFGIPKPMQHLSDEDLSRFQQAYQQIHDLVAPYKGMGDAAVLHVTHEDKSGQPTEHVVSVPGKGKPIVGLEPPAGHKITSAHIAVQGGPDFGGATYDTLGALGAPDRLAAMASTQGSGGLLDPARIGAYQDQMDLVNGQDDYMPSRRLFQRLEHGSKLLQDSFGDTAPRKVQYALAVGQHVGRYGPEAQRVIGPSADKAAYRYRGTERAIDPRLGRDLTEVARDPRLRQHNGDGTPNPERTAAARRQFLLHGVETDAGWNPSAVVSYFRGTLPKTELAQLQVKSGKVPPSQGIILDKNGKAQHQSVGFGDDWYLPFNLKNLKALKGGEYIRTRTYGGPTTEDLYTGLVGGARAMTVVSNNGTYTVDFDDNLRGGRRFNDKAAAMVGRYGQLLDAVRSGQVETGGIDPTRLAELQAKASAKFPVDQDPARNKAEYKRLVTLEKETPLLSSQQRSEAAVEYLSSLADKETDAAGQVQSVDGMVANYVNRAATKAYQEDVAQQRQMRAAARAQGLDAGSGPILATRSLDDYRDTVAASLEDPTAEGVARKYAAAIGKESGLDSALKKAQDDYARALKPLQLDGAGYATALDALQEQFPYYIKGVAFHPWEGGSNGRDSGYVRPGRNRPAEALAGYFDTHSGRGGGKVHADTTRFQGGLKVPRRVSTEASPGEKAKESAGAAVAGGVSDTDKAHAAKAAKADADKALFDHLLAQKTYSQKADVLDARGKPVSISHLTATYPDLYGVMSVSPDEYATAARDPGWHDKLIKGVKQAEQAKLFDLDPAIVGAATRGGTPAVAKALPSDTAQVLGNSSNEYDLSDLGSAYRPGSGATAEQIRAAYRSDPDIKKLVDSYGLTATLDDPDFGMVADQLEAEAKTQHNANEYKRVRGDQVLPGDAQAASAAGSGLVRARTLKRHLTEAVKNEAQVMAPSGNAAAPITTNRILVMDADDPRAPSSAWLQEHGLPPIVSS